MLFELGRRELAGRAGEPLALVLHRFQHVIRLPEQRVSLRGRQTVRHQPRDERVLLRDRASCCATWRTAISRGDSCVRIALAGLAASPDSL